MYADAETGLYYVWHRYYDPKIGRFISSDPIGLVGGLNTYTYVRNNPLRYTDPTGLFDPGVGTIVESTLASVGAIGSAAVAGIGSLLFSSPAGDPSDMIPPGSPSSSDKNNCPKCDLKFEYERPSFDGRSKSCVYSRKGQIFTFPQWKDKPCYPINYEACMVDTSTLDPALYYPNGKK